MRNIKAFSFVLAAAFLALGMRGSAIADEKKYDPGASDTEVLIGNTMPYSGPLSAYGTIGKAMAAYFKKVNAEGGVNGRAIRFVSLDDGYVPTNTLSQTRKLVERDKVLLMLSVLGTPPNMAVRGYLNERKIPHLFGLTGQTALGDYQNYPYTMGWQPSFQTEANIYVQHLMATNPNAKVAILFQNGDYGKDFKKGLADAFGDKWGKMVVAEAAFEPTDPTVDTQIVTLKASGADTLFLVATPKFVAQAIKKAKQLEWNPVQYVNNVANSITSVMTPSGAIGDTSGQYITSFYAREPNDPQWANTKEVKDWQAWMKAHYPDGDITDNMNVYGYNLAQTMVQLLTQMGNDLTRENAMKQARNLDMKLPMLLPGISIKTGAKDYFPLEQLQLARWKGQGWQLFGEVFSAK
jgi:branched-chain amino acid transport system substrate-binding protein